MTTDGESVEIISDLFLDVLARRDIHRFGGPAVAAVPIIGGLALKAYSQGYDLKGYFVRSEAKTHGMGKLIEGHIAPGEKVAVWDDAISTGGSLFSAIEAISELPAEIDVVFTILDRNQGGSDQLMERSIPLFSILSSNAEGRVVVDHASLREWFE